MCQTKAQGGRRCASHLRARLDKITTSTQQWDDAAADYATTDAGADDLRTRLAIAERTNDHHQAARLTTALNRGASSREARQAADTLINTPTAGPATIQTYQHHHPDGTTTQRLRLTCRCGHVTADAPTHFPSSQRLLNGQPDPDETCGRCGQPITQVRAA